MATIGIFLLAPMIPEDMPRLGKKLTVIGIGFLCLIPRILTQIVSVFAFDVMPQQRKVTYEFLDADYAAEFAALNESEIINDEGD